MAFPEINSCLVCEGSRPELGGKHTLLGFYGIAPRVRISFVDFAEPATLCLFFIGGPGEGNFTVGMRVNGPQGFVFEATPVQGQLVAGRLNSFFIMAIQTPLPGPGQYRFTLTVNGRDYYPTTVDIAQGSREEMFGPR